MCGQNILSFPLCKPTRFFVVAQLSPLGQEQGAAMDNNAAQQLVAAKNALAATAMAIPPAVLVPLAAPPLPPLTSLYKGRALDLTSCHASSLFHDGCAMLDSKFTGKVDALQLFLADLKTCTKACCWDSATHDILSITVAGTMHNLLDDYGKLSEAQDEAAHILQNNPASSTRARQNRKKSNAMLHKGMHGHALASVACDLQLCVPTRLGSLVSDTSFSDKRRTGQSCSAHFLFSV